MVIITKNKEAEKITANFKNAKGLEEKILMFKKISILFKADLNIQSLMDYIKNPGDWYILVADNLHCLAVNGLLTQKTVEAFIAKATNCGLKKLKEFNGEINMHKNDRIKTQNILTKFITEVPECCIT